MEHKTCSRIVNVAAAANGTDDPNKSHQPHELAELQALLNVVTRLVLACSRAALLAAVTYSFAVTAWRERREPEDLAFVVGAFAALAALLLCLRRVERLAPDSAPHAERRRLHAAVWALSTALSTAFAYRVSLLMPAALVVVVWCMTSFVVLLGFYLLVLSCEDQQCYQSVDDDVDCHTAGDCGKPLVNNKM